MGTDVASALRRTGNQGAHCVVCRDFGSLWRVLDRIVSASGEHLSRYSHAEEQPPNKYQLALRQKYTLRALLSLATLLPTLLLTLITTIWAHMLNNNAPEVDTIQTWTCKMQSSQPLDQDLPADIAMPAGMGNSDFKTLCGASKFALYGTLIVFLLVGASMAVTMITWMADKWAARQQRKEVEMGNIPVNN